MLYLEAERKDILNASNKNSLSTSDCPKDTGCGKDMKLGTDNVTCVPCNIAPR